MTLSEIQNCLYQSGVSREQARPFLILEAIALLHHAGWATSIAIVNDPSDHLGNRRYWRLPSAQA